MEKKTLTQEFARRLHQSMIAAGHLSERSSSGIDIKKLVEISGHSAQICRKYLRGQAMPEPVKLAEIAMKLHVSPGWLLFGDVPGVSPHFTISKELLHYMFTHASKLYRTGRPVDEIADFLLDVATDVSQINADEEQSKRIIDLTLSSVTYFKMPDEHTENEPECMYE
jgi:hypothetical protein